MMSRIRSVWATTPRHARRVLVAVIGGTIVLLGIALIVLPGPSFIVIPAGLAILATEFAWARLWLRKIKRVFRRDGDKAQV